jgi:HNH endonuclease
MNKLYETPTGLSQYPQPSKERYEQILAERNAILDRLNFHPKARRYKSDYTDKEWILLNSIIDPQSGCRVWAKSLQNVGYGFVNIWNEEKSKWQMETAHRVAYKEWIGEIPSGLIVGHACDTTYCCNWDHLILFTRQDNTDDMVRKGRYNKTTNAAYSRVECPHCEKTGQYAIMQRWHFDNCKDKRVFIETEQTADCS